MWGWLVYYEPELIEENALFALPDEGNGMKQEYRRHYSPASFTVGESGIWFFSPPLGGWPGRRTGRVSGCRSR